LNRTSFLDGFIIQNGLADGGSNRTVNGKSHSRAKGGGINSLNADLEIHNCWVRGNECDVSGGGIFLGNTDCSIYNTVISGNVAGSQGGGITESGSDLTIINTTVAGNYALGGGGATGFFDAVNSIIWGNDASSFSPETFGSISFDYSLVKDANPPGTGNLNGTSASNDPMFINPITASLTPTILGDYRVSPCPVSPVVDAGSNGANSTAFALGGDARKLDGDNNGNARIDIGAYESELPILTSSISVSACDSYTVPSGDETYLTSQIVTDTISGSCGADSVITIDLAIEFNDVIQDDIATDTICGFESLSYSASTSFVSYADFESANSDYINLNVLADDIAESDRSVFMWINSAAVSSREALFAINSNTGGNISLWFINSDNEFELYDGSGYETSGVVVADESWHYVGYTYSETTSETKLYVDGVEVLTHIDVQFADAYSQISLGQEFDGTNTTNHYNGLMTEVSVWNAVLSPTDIVTAMSAAIEPSHPAYSSLVGYYPMNSTCGTSLELVEDFSGNEEHAMASSSEIVKLDDLQEIPTFNSTYWYNLEWNSTKAGSFSTAENVAPSVDTTTAFSLRYTRDFVEVTEYWAVVEAGSLIDVSVTDASPTFTANTTGLAYQWLDCDNGYAIISGETDQTFTAMGSGNYAVEVTQDGCADTSACYNATIIGLEGKGLEKSISVYPNPTSNDINVEIESFSSETVTIEVYDQLGRTIQTGSIAKDVSRKTTLSLDGYGAGSYFVKCYTHTSTKYFKVVKI
ncbi:MAG: LamG-like jellyroll fold domain-containing protein, partial [Flavobacteriales bacterium]